MNYFTMAKDLVILIALGAVLYLVYRGGEDRVRAKDLQGLQDQMKAQGRILEGWRTESKDANDKLAKDVAAINAAAANPVKHTWVCTQSGGKPTVLSGSAGQADSGHPAGGGVQPGPGEAIDGDRRDAIVAGFKQRWETTLAGCRAEDAQWPQ